MELKSDQGWAQISCYSIAAVLTVFAIVAIVIMLGTSTNMAKSNMDWVLLTSQIWFTILASFTGAVFMVNAVLRAKPFEKVIKTAGIGLAVYVFLMFVLWSSS